MASLSICRKCLNWNKVDAYVFSTWYIPLLIILCVVYADDVPPSLRTGDKAPPSKRRKPTGIPSQIATGLVHLIGQKKLNQQGAGEVAQLYSDQLQPVLAGC